MRASAKIESIPIAFVAEGSVVWSSESFKSLNSQDQSVLLQQASVVPNSLVTEVLLSEGPMQSVALVPVSERSELLVFTPKGDRSLLTPSSSIELLALLIHDLRSPITSIYGFSETILASGESFSRDEILVFLNKIRSSALRANVLLNNMQALSAGVRASGRAKVFVFNALVREVVDGVWLEPGSRITLELSNADTTLTLDHIATERIVGNLVNNAAKFCAKDGEIVISTKSTQEMVELEVSNTGPRIPNDELGLIFERFQRGSTSRGKSGTGLGLFIVKHLAAQLNAKVSAKSDEQMTTFSVQFPRS